MKMERAICLPLLILLAAGRANGLDRLETSYWKEGKIVNERIDIGFMDRNGRISNRYIAAITFSRLDSISIENGNPNRISKHATPLSLDFSKKVKKHSREYYSLYAGHHIIRALDYYSALFEDRLDFNADKEYRSIGIAFGDIPEITDPKYYILRENSDPSPSLFYHEVGHRAFWLLESQLGIRFGGLTFIHMGLLEYFTVSLNDSPLVGEDFFPAKIFRDASRPCRYRESLSSPASARDETAAEADDELKLKHTLRLLKESYPREMRDDTKSITKYYKAVISFYGKALDEKYDNHRAGMVITGTLWRIRQRIGREKTDRLVARTIIDLNRYIGKRNDFYVSAGSGTLADKVMWFDLYYGLMEQDKELHAGENRGIIKEEFSRTGFPLDHIRCCPLHAADPLLRSSTCP